MTKLMTIVLSAGEGTRMKSDLPKVLHQVAGLPMVGHVLKACEFAGANEKVLVVGPNHTATEEFAAKHFDNISICKQMERLGTGHAVKTTKEHWLTFDDYIFVLFADNPLVQPQTIENASKVLDDGADIVVVGYEPADPTGLGRLLLEGEELVAIREHKDATDEERQVGLCNSGIMGFKADALRAVIDEIDNKNAQSEYYLTDAPEIARSKDMVVKTSTSPEEEVLGVNDRRQLAFAEATFQQKARDEAMLSGVTLVAPETVFFSHDTIVERDVIIEPNVFFGPGAIVKSGATIHAFSHIEGATVGEGAQIGPYARLRPGANMGKNSKAGNFVEVKKAEIGEGAKINHLTYIGDAEIGAKTNIGAGTITCNYDGKKKYKTTVGVGAFIGSNSALVAPVTIDDGAYVASGSVVTHNVEKDALAIGRSKQINKPGYAEKIRKRWEE